MSDRSQTGSERRDALRSLPAAHRLAADLAARPGAADAPAGLVTEAARTALARLRERLLSGERGDDSDLVAEAIRDLRALQRPLRPAINATGIILHTGLGRAPLAREAVEALSEVAGGYAPVELDMLTGRRGRRELIVRDLLQRLTGAPAACVVNNNAAAMLLMVAALAKGRSVVVSRGELIEIGGSFRLPEVLEAGGARLIEVGTTNKTRLRDYERAFEQHDDIAMLLKVHPSNFHIEGFTLETTVEELAALGRERGALVAHDIGSGVLDPEHAALLPSREPDAASSVAAGADLVLFSGDKALGGPQCGVVVGGEGPVGAMLTHPMMRALRVDKTTLAALGATLALHLAGGEGRRRIPALAALGQGSTLRERAEGMAEAIRRACPRAQVEAMTSRAYLGGGAAPAQGTPSAGVSIALTGVGESDLAGALRRGEPAVLARVQEGRVMLDLCAVPAEADGALLEAVLDACNGIVNRV